jgi:hypothetical protein
MTPPRKLPETALYSLIRLSPILAPVAIVPLFLDDPLLVQLRVQIALITICLIGVWNMTEGAMILLMEAREAKSAQARGYLISTFLLVIVLLGMLQYFRMYSSQPLFIVMLGILSLRGMSRSGWENSRPTVAFVAAIAGHSLLALCTFSALESSISWQSALCSLAIGLSVAGVEASWNSTKITKDAASRFIIPLFRLTVSGGPIIIVTMALAHQLHPFYVATALLLIPARKIILKAKTPDSLPAQTLRGPAGIYLLFLTIMSVCIVAATTTAQ